MRISWVHKSVTLTLSAQQPWKVKSALHVIFKNDDPEVSSKK